MTPSAPCDLLRRWLAARLPAEAIAWLDTEAASARDEAGDRRFHRAFSQVARRIPEGPLGPSPAERAAAEAARAGWQPGGWDLRTAARLVLLLTAAAAGPERFPLRLDQLVATADLGETVTVLRGLPLYPDPDRHVARARAATRANAVPVFEALAHHNPFPAERFDDEAWNRMVLKAVFIGSRLAPIVGLDRRANPALAALLRDYAAECRAAGRPVSDEVWRCVRPFAPDDGREPA